MHSTRIPAWHHRLARLLLAGALLLSGCAPGLEILEPDARIIFWHDWSGADAALLDELIDNFHQLNPAVSVIAVPHERAGLAAEFADRSAEGLEPDLILADAGTAQELIAGGFAKELSSLGVDAAAFNAAALSTVSENDRIYALPFALSTQLLFYNKSSVSQPPSTLADLRQLTARPDIAMGLNTTFLEAYWGLRAFGGRSYDDSGQFMLDQGALTNWLAALTAIQGAAGFVLSSDQEQLRQQFLQGEISLYVADASEVSVLAAVLGEELGVAPLPHGANGDPAGPLLQAGVLLISANASAQETAAALEFARFLTNSQQQSLLAFSETGQLSAVETVHLSPNMPEVVLQLANQLSSAVPVTLAQRTVWDEVAARGQTIYRAVLEGALDEQEAADQLVAIVDTLRPANAGDASAFACPELTNNRTLTLTLWHSWSDEETAVLETQAANFHSLCPSVTISPTQISNSTTLNERFRAATQVGSGPHILIGSTQWMALLAEAEMIAALDNDLRPGELANLIPAAVSAVQYDGRMYAYPESVRSVALIYNPTLVTAPPRTLHDLLLQVDNEHPLVMPLTFFYAYWGLAAFGGAVSDTDSETGPALQLDQTAASDWLDWLRTAARRPGFHFTTGRAEAEYAFLEGEAAYLVSGPWSLPRLQAAMPADEIAVALLPAGPADRARPILEVEGVMINATASQDAAAAGLAFARYLAGADSARALLATGVHVPANVTVSLAEMPLIDVLSEQAQMASGVVQDHHWQPVFAYGDTLYQSVVLENADSEAALAAFADAINRTPAAPASD